MHSYTYLNPERVLSGAGCISELPAELKRLGCERAFVLSTRSLDERTNAVRKLESLLGGAWAATYGRCRQHSPRATVGEAAEAARACRADALVVLGGGSVTDTAKALAIVSPARMRPRRASSVVINSAMPVIDQAINSAG